MSRTVGDGLFRISQAIDHLARSLDPFRAVPGPRRTSLFLLVRRDGFKGLALICAGWAVAVKWMVPPATAADVNYMAMLVLAYWTFYLLYSYKIYCNRPRVPLTSAYAPPAQGPAVPAPGMMGMGFGYGFGGSLSTVAPVVAGKAEPPPGEDG